jgi:glycosyltransferase 2 family protein
MELLEFMKRSWQLILSLALTLAIGYLLYRAVPNWGESLRVMLRARPLMILAGSLFIALHMILRAERWGVLLSGVKHRISFRNLLSITLVRYVVNLVPPRAGEVAGSLVLARKEKIPAVSVIAATILERILDLITIIVLFAVYLVFYSGRYTPDSERGRNLMLNIQEYSVKSLVLVGIAFAVVAILLKNPNWFARVPFAKSITHFLGGFRALGNRHAFVKTAALSVGIWLAITLQQWFFVRAYLDRFPLPGTLVLVAVTVVGVAIPTPLGIGGFQFFMTVALVQLFPRYLSAVDPQSQAAGISNGCYLFSMVPVVVAGLFCLNLEGLSLSRLANLAARNGSREAQ